MMVTFLLLFFYGWCYFCFCMRFSANTTCNNKMNTLSCHQDTLKIILLIEFCWNSQFTRTHLSDNHNNDFPHQLLILKEVKIDCPDTNSTDDRLSHLLCKVRTSDRLNISRSWKYIRKRLSLPLFRGNSVTHKQHSEWDT